MECPYGPSYLKRVDSQNAIRALSLTLDRKTTFCRHWTLHAQ